MLVGTLWLEVGGLMYAANSAARMKVSLSMLLADRLACCGGAQWYMSSSMECGQANDMFQYSG